MLQNAGIPVKELPEGVEYHLRSGEQADFAFYLNRTDQMVKIPDVRGVDLVTDARLDGDLILPAFGVAVIRINMK